eukprot:9555569-Lingulodinium_polyedra.AAC.1
MGVAFQEALRAAAAAGGDYGAGRGLAAAIARAFRRFAWSVANARQWRTDAGVEVHVVRVSLSA